jgi:SagB-type dehydrogenase family enzyme
MTDAPAPLVFAALRSFAYEPQPAWPTESAGNTDTDTNIDIDIAEEFHEASKIAAAFPSQSLGPAGRLLTSSAEAPFALGRKALTAVGPRIELPQVSPLPVDLRAVVHARRSELPEQCGRARLDQLATVLGLSAGASPTRPGLRVTPSAGAMYPLDVVVVANAVEQLPPGAYVYDPIAHALLLRGDVDPGRFHAVAGIGSAPPPPSFLLAVVATFARSRAKYGLRGYRFALIEAGHVVQAALTVGTALGLATLPWGGFADAAVDQELDMDGLERSCVYLLAMSADADDGGRQ